MNPITPETINPHSKPTYLSNLLQTPQPLPQNSNKALINNPQALPSTMKAVFLDKPSNSLIIKEIPLPKPDPEHVLIKVEASLITPADLRFLEGKSLDNTHQTQVGFEGSGTVLISGGGFSSRHAVGKRVSFYNKPGKYGAWAEYAIVPAQNCFQLDNNVSFEVGACGISSPFTAAGLVKNIKSEKHKAIVQTIRHVQLGRMLTRLCKKEGIKVINVVRKEEEKALFEGLGADFIISSQEDDFEQKIKSKAEEIKATCLLDCISAENTSKVMKAMPRGSICYMYGYVEGGKMTKVDFTDILANNKSIKSFEFWQWFLEQGTFSRVGVVNKVQKLLKNELKSEIERVYTLQEVNEAIRYYRESLTVGEVLIKPN